MKYAQVNGQRLHAKDVPSGTLGCDIWFPAYEVKACVGEYLQYWVYTNGKPQLPPGYEPESNWHASWKNLVNDDCTEVICGTNNEHRADILANDHVIEIQKSRIDIRDARERVNFYRELLPKSRVIWVIDVQESWKSKRLSAGSPVKDKRNIFNLVWGKGSRHKWMVDIARTPDTHVYFEFNQHNEKLIKVWINKGKLLASWKTKKSFFDEYLATSSELEPSDIHEVLGYKPK
ncbi:hypothetical protein [Colwellia psychrerythraea]|uniref:Uncharacterized protein n=1 Tax=Colwellia psychrerythraea TaxID=28229 RepID=A0A099KZD5_COLPS|nr:hypothetical protein [Colwellia psychrerythraea]KGJ95192.1 hypothetical protein GAB14E_1974 [Colwellia psychrerythraea]